MRFILKRILSALITIFLVSVLCFITFNIIRGDPVSTALGTTATAEQEAILRKETGLDQNPVVRYFQWFGNFFSGNLGNSMRFQGEAVSSLILSRLPVSLVLTLLSLLFTLLIATPLSLLSMHRKTKLPGVIINIFTAVGIGIPNFFMGIIFIWVFGVVMRLFIPGIYSGYTDLVFPALAIAIPNAAVLIKFLRSSLSKELNSDYVRTAYSKGASHSIVLRRHALRNAVIPSVAILGMIIAETLSGSIIIEKVFSIPGIGLLLLSAINARDYQLIQTLVVYITFIVILVNTLVDISIQYIDPRIRLEKEKNK